MWVVKASFLIKYFPQTGGLFGGTPAATPSAFGFGQTSTASTGGLFGGTAGFGAAAAKVSFNTISDSFRF